MDIDRRTFLTATPTVLAGAVGALGAIGQNSPAVSAESPATARKSFRRIATEEAFCTPLVASASQEVARKNTTTSLDLDLVQAIFDSPPGGRAAPLLPRLLDLEGERLRIMDENEISMHLLSLTAPGVQMFDADTATELAINANDLMVETIRRHPTRFSGLASFPPQAPKRAVKEMERAINKLKLNGFIVNSHTNNEYLDDEKFWPIFEAAESLNAAIYLHPRCPSDGMSEPFRYYGMEGALWGFGMETGTHAVRLISCGVFDRFPKLRIVLGHMGEAVPFWLWRLDYMHRFAFSHTKKLELTPSEYFKRNFAITTSGMESPEALQYSINVLGIENVMWAIDYPYQPMKPAVQFMNSAPVSHDQRELLFHGNAERIFHISG